ncbi:MAG: PIN domain-containing protein [Actinomycetota bacterium]
MDGLIDTSVFIGREQGRPVGDLPLRGGISVMTLAELHVGALVATDDGVRAARIRTLASTEGTFDAIPVDDAVARRFAELVAAGSRQGLRFQVADALIGATSLVLGVPVYTQDADFDRMPGVIVRQV